MVRLLQDNEVAPTVVELNLETVRELREEGIDGVYGDATRPDTLAGAGVANAGTLIPHVGGHGEQHRGDPRGARAEPGLRVLARAAYLRDLPTLREAGADSVYSGEGEVALAFIEDILDSLGATPEQIDRERARAHDELFGDSPTARLDRDPRSRSAVRKPRE